MKKFISVVFIDKNQLKQNFLIMRLMTFLLLVAMFPTFATGYSQSTVIKFTEKPKILADVIETIENQTDYRIFYKTDQVSPEKPVDIKKAEPTVAEALKTSFEGSNISYTVMGQMIVLAPTVSAIQGAKVTGTVTDDNGVTMPGVSIQIEGTTIGTVTDVNGKYSIELPGESGVLIFTFIGYTDQKIEVKGGTIVNIKMQMEATNLDQIVVVGYGSIRKKDITGAVGSIKSSEFKNQVISSSAQILKGRVAGVSVTQLSGMPGGDYKIRIRGANSLIGNNAPLLVVDGIQVNIGLNDINSNDIESIEILKDASSTAIYGSRGANGVLLITTKNGAEGKPVVEINSDISFSKAKNPYTYMDPYTYATTTNLLTSGAAYTADEVEGFKTAAGVSMYDALLQTGTMFSNSVTVRGGSKTTKYFLSSGFDTQEGVLIGTTHKKYMVRSNVTTQIADKLSVGLNLTAVQVADHNIMGGYNELLYAQCWGPTVPILNSDGTYNKADPYGSFSYNPYMLMNEMNRDSYRTNGLLSTNIKWDIISGLSFNANVGVSLSNSDNGYVNNEYYALSGNVGGQTGSGTGHYMDRFWQLSNTLTYTKTINATHNFTVMAGFEESASKGRYTTADGKGLLTTSVGYDNLGLNSVQAINSGYSESSLRSYIARANYSFKDRYLLTATFRSDGSSKFRGDNVYSNFPSVGLGWRLSEENFIKNLKIFSNLKIRGSWGKTGSQAIQSYGTMSLLASSNYSYGVGNTYPGVKLEGVPNPDLKWETTTQMDIGLDASFFESRLNFTFDYYSKLTTDLLQEVPLPAYNGGGVGLQNIGSVENKGFEFSVNAVAIQNDDWNLNLGFNINWMENKVKDLGEDDMIFAGSSSFSQENIFVLMPGQPMGTFYGYKRLGVWTTAEKDTATLFRVKPGSNKYEDINGDHKIDANDLQVLGHAMPTWRSGFNTTIGYKNFSLYALLEGAFGMQVYNEVYAQAVIPSSNGKTVTLADGADYWTTDNENAQFANLLTKASNNLPNSSQWLQDGSFIKLRTVTLSYQLKKEKIKFADMRLFVSGQNLLTISNYLGNDPENSNTGSDDRRGGLDSGIYPTVKTVTAGLTLTF